MMEQVILHTTQSFKKYEKHSEFMIFVYENRIFMIIIVIVFLP